MRERKAPDVEEGRWWTKSHTLFLTLFILFASGTLFILDLKLKLGATIPVLYTGVIWAASLFPYSGLLVPVGLTSSCLTLLGFFFSPSGLASDWVVLFNRGLSLFVIWLTVIFLIQRKAAEQASDVLSNLAGRISNGAFSCNQQGEIQWQNEGLARLIPHANEIGDVRDLFYQPHLQQFYEEFMQVVRRGEQWSQEVLLTPSDFNLENAEKIWVQVDCEPSQNAFGELSGSFVLVSDISRTKADEERLREYLSYAKSIVMNMSKALVVVNADFSVDIGNRAFQELFRLEGEEFVGVNVPTIVSEGTAAQSLQEQFSIVSSGEEDSVTLELELQGKDILVIITRLNVSGVSGKRFTVSFLDVSDYKNALRSLESANDELRQFAYVASHDLQEPLRKISSFLQILEEDYRNQLDEEARECIDFAVDGANRLQRLISDLLSFTGLTRADSREFKEVDCAAALAVVLDNLQPLMEESSAVIQADYLPKVLGNRTHIEQVLQNLIGNAVKYQGGSVAPQIKIACEQEGSFWRFSVADNGIGIDSQYQEKVFRIFQRLHSKEEFAGTGIGLAICKRIVEAHGGKIWFTSVPQEGTTFFFTLRRYAP